MKLILKDESGNQIDIDFKGSDKFDDIALKVARKYGKDLDVSILESEKGRINPHVNFLDYFSTSYNDDKVNENVTKSGDPHGSEKSSVSCYEQVLETDCICRLCAKKTARKELLPIEDFEIKINFCLPIKVSRDDGHSQSICVTCAESLDVTKRFVDQCLRADAHQRLDRSDAVGSSISSANAPGQLPKTYQCDKCGKKFRGKIRLCFHVQHHESGLPLGYCRICSKEFLSETCLYKHFLHSHKMRNFTCQEPGVPITSSLCHKEYVHKLLKPYICDLCKQLFSRRNTLRDHVLGEHCIKVEGSHPVVECCECNEIFPHRADGLTHTYIHHGGVEKTLTSCYVSELFICEYCDKCFGQPDRLIEHRLFHTPPNLFNCKFCNAEFPTYFNLYSHIEDHIRDGVIDFKGQFSAPIFFVCQYCDTRFNSYEAFHQHSKLRSFESSKSAQMHRTSHIATVGGSFKLYNCKLCNKSFNCSSGLAKHVRIHTREKPYKCPKCRKSFTQSSGLYTHLKVHSDDRPYKCDVCEKSFKIIGDYKVHVRRHSGERSFQCQICPKAFLTKKTFLQHQRAHEGVKPYQCQLCEVAFRRSHTLKLHCQRHHKAD